jgi:RimJ/RimL family protein N-acetyltransferase
MRLASGLEWLPMKRKDLGNYTYTENLRDGRSVTIRAIRPDDKGNLIDALNKVSPQSLYFRLFSGKRKFSDEEVNQITKVDFVNVVALVAVLEKDGVERIVGGGRYIRIGTSETGQSAEVAFLIDDAHQGLGIGSRIFKHLVAIARESGITHFEAEVLPSNAPMLRLFERSGLRVEKTLTGGSVHVTIQLAPAEAVSRRSRMS